MNFKPLFKILDALPKKEKTTAEVNLSTPSKLGPPIGSEDTTAESAMESSDNVNPAQNLIKVHYDFSPHTSSCNSADWKLKLMRNKLAGTFLFKTPDFWPISSIRQLFDTCLRPFLPDLQKNCIKHVTHLFSYDLERRVILTFHSPHLADQIYKLRDDLGSQGILVHRYFVNKAPPNPLFNHSQLQPAHKENHLQVLSSNNRRHGHTSSPPPCAHDRILEANTTSEEWITNNENFLPEEHSLLESYDRLPKIEQAKIVSRLSHLIQRLTKEHPEANGVDLSNCPPSALEDFIDSSFKNLETHSPWQPLAPNNNNGVSTSVSKTGFPDIQHNKMALDSPLPAPNLTWLERRLLQPEELGNPEKIQKTKLEIPRNPVLTARVTSNVNILTPLVNIITPCP
ncbi:uncharacterized protein LOC133387186 [Rhineura floridana]|uniref:uncharacterized protein LOC133387186 n=1 Tax=Rhineura floridana TaxID=261503 RepID=UPI002AC87F88|nr:uncharacterized protein LOC133387186 [Rhineura floridana]